MGQTDRTIALLRRLVRTRDPEERLEALLASRHIAVRLGEVVAAQPHAQLVFSFAVNLLARLHPVIQRLDVVVPTDTPLTVSLPRWSATTLNEHIRLFLEALNPPVQWSLGAAPPDLPDCTLLIGAAPVSSKEVVFVGGDGWSATVSPLSAVPIGDQANPVGAYAAACLGVAEVWKRLLGPHRHLFEGMAILPLDEPLTFSTFSYRVGPAEPNPDLPETIDLRDLTIVGLGAGGGAAAFALASLHDIRGILNLIEPDEIIDSNLNRYVFADGGDSARRRAKAETTAALFSRFVNLEVRPFAASYGAAVPSLSVEDHRYVVATVHSREARRELQFETPMVLWDAGATEQGEFFVWRMILGITECMWCKHPPGERDPELEKATQLEQLIGLNVAIWLQKLRNNDTFKADEVNAIAVLLAGKDAPFDPPSAGQRYGDWEAEQCGRLPLPAADEEIPIPFAPVMAGVLLAGEIIKEHYFPEAVLDSYYWNTLVGRFMRRNQPNRRLPRPECSFCTDGIYLSQYLRRWGANHRFA